MEPDARELLENAALNLEWAHDLVRECRATRDARDRAEILNDVARLRRDVATERREARALL